LSYPDQLPAAHDVLTELPDLPVVIDHLSKPSYDWERDAEWRTWMTRLAARPATTCKLSGLVTEVGPDWTVERFRPYAQFAFETFGADRVMFGSDWPVCRLVAEYGDVVALAEQLTGGLAPHEASDVWCGTAARFYGVEVVAP
jgi:L-fuconolactonase